MRMFGSLGMVIGVVACVGCGGVEPQSGGWHYTEKVTQDGCHVKDTGFGDGGDFLLSNNGDGTFVIDPADSEAKFDCTLDGDDFECPTEVFEQVTAPGVAAVLRIRVSVAGTFGSSTEASGTRHGTASCEGSDCGLAESSLGTKFPCAIDTEFDSEARQP